MYSYQRQPRLKIIIVNNGYYKARGRILMSFKISVYMRKVIQ
jgi:hypothetical protein